MTTLHCRPQVGQPGSPATEVVIGHGVANSVRGRAAGRRVLCLVDARIADRHPELLDPDWTTMPVVAGEALKTLGQAEVVLRSMAAAGLDRSCLLIAIGGGTVGDLGGLCAGLYLRGVECWQVPTTLLAMVDSAVGGKTAVNLPEGKNLVGCVHPPTLVAVDPGMLSSLSATDFKSGLAEVLKAAIGLDATLFELLERDAAAIDAREDRAIETAIRLALAAKIAVVEADLRECGTRRLLNLGHTLGHALEAWSGYSQPHGLCVARGLHFALDVAVAEGAMDPEAADRSRRLLITHGHAAFPLPPAEQLEPFLRRDKKALGDSIRFIVPTAIGRSAERSLPLATLVRRLADAQEPPGAR